MVDANFMNIGRYAGYVEQADEFIRGRLMNDSYKAAFEYLYDSESTKDLPIQPQVIARVAKLMDRQAELLAALKSINDLGGFYETQGTLVMKGIARKALDSVEGK